MQRLFGIADLLEAAEQSRAEFLVRLAGLAEWYPRSVNALLAMNYYRGELSSPESERGRFEFFSASHFAQIPYTLWAVYDLMARGFYREANILVRKPT